MEGKRRTRKQTEIDATDSRRTYKKGQKVVTRWKDCRKYDAVIIDVLPNDILKVKFDEDGFVTSMKSSLVVLKDKTEEVKKLHPKKKINAASSVQLRDDLKGKTSKNENVSFSKTAVNCEDEEHCTKYDSDEQEERYVLVDNQLNITNMASRLRKRSAKASDLEIPVMTSSSEDSETSSSDDEHSVYCPSEKDASEKGTSENDVSEDEASEQDALESNNLLQYASENDDHVSGLGTSLSCDIDPEHSDLQVNMRASVKENNAAPRPPSGNITVACTSNTFAGRRWDKKHYCLFCTKPYSKIARHLQTAHSSKIQVQEVMSLSDKKAKLAGLCKLRNLGNHKHNKTVICKQEGILQVGHRPQANTDPNKYVPCPSCYAWYSGRQLSKHKCLLKKKRNNEQVLRKSRLLVPVPDHVSQEAREIFCNMWQDQISLVAKNDRIISELCRQLFNRKGGKSLKAKSVISHAVRLTSRLLLQLRERPEHKSCSMLSCIDPQQFRDIVEAVKVVAGYDRNTQVYAHPETARFLGTNLKKCATIAQSLALEDNDVDLLSKAERFIKLFDINFGSEVNAQAVRNRKTNKLNSPKRIPLTEDVVKLSKYLKTLSEENRNLLQSSPSRDEEKLKAWNTLQQVTLSQVITFNRRREGEVSLMTVKNYQDKYGKELRSDVEETLCESEKHLCKILTRVEILGKGDRIVPVLLTPDYVKGIDLLLEWRNAVGVTQTNPYLFARTHGSERPLRGSDCIRRFSKECGAHHPEYLRSTLLRKHVATLSQVLNLKEHELDLLATFMGHNIKIHRNFYRLPDDTLQIAKLSKLFIALEKGALPGQQGKSLDEIEVSLNEEISDLEDASDDENDESHVLANDPPKKCSVNDDVDKECNSYLDDEDEPVAMASGKVKSKLQVKKKGEVGVDPSITSRLSRRVRWSEEEKDAVERHLVSYVLLNKLPGADAIRKCLDKEPSLKRRTWKNVKYFCQWLIQDRKKKGLQ